MLRVLDLQLAIDRTEAGTYVRGMAHRTSSRAQYGDLASLLMTRYGRDGNIHEVGYDVTFNEAAHRVAALWWMRLTPQDAVASFRATHLQTRLDLLLADLLRHPDDSPTARWARQYGFASPSATSRAFRLRYGVPMGHARRIGRLGQWLAAERRSPRQSRGRARRREAERRMELFEAVIAPRGLGLAASAAMASVRSAVPTAARSRPRYPTLSVWEHSRLHGGVV